MEIKKGEKFLEGMGDILISSMQKGYGKNDYHRHGREERTIVTQLGKTTFTLTRVKDKSTGKTFCPLTV